MKRIFLTLFITALAHCTQAQWTTSGNNIYNSNSGYVGIGTTTPTANLSVTGNRSAIDWGTAGINFQTLQAIYTNTTSSGTVAMNAVNALGVPFLAASSATTYTHASTFYIANAPFLSTNVTITNPWALYVNAGNSAFNGKVIVGNAFPANSNGKLVINQAGGGINTGVVGVHLLVNGNTYTDTSTPANTTALHSVGSSFNGGVLAATNANVTYGNASTVLIIGPPTASTNVTITNPWAFYVLQGNTYYGGNVGIGTANFTGYKLAVNGTIHAKEVDVDLNNWSDYVFYKGYRLRPLSAVKTYIDQNHHLPDVPSEQQIIKDGINLGEMNKLLLKKVEELTLYMIELIKKLKEQQTEINKLKTKHY